MVEGGMPGVVAYPGMRVAYKGPRKFLTAVNSVTACNEEGSVVLPRGAALLVAVQQ